MISISGIKYQKELEEMPYFNKATAGILIGKKGKNLDKKIERLIKKQYLLPLKKGLYTSSIFVLKTNKKLYQEYLANILRFPSYLSLEYILDEYNLIPEGIYNLNSITLKSGRTYENFLGSFTYRNIKPELFFGWEEKEFEGKKIKIALPAKALFDFLYLKKMINLEREIIKDLRINWGNFSPNDFKLFKSYIQKAKSAKMTKILAILEKNL